MTTAARASGPRLRVLRVLHDKPVVDRSGRAVHILCQAARFDRQDALAQVLARMDHEGLIRREVQGRRTYLIEITEAGRRLAGLPGSDPSAETAGPSRLRFESLPPGPASTWRGGNDDPIVETDDEADAEPAQPATAVGHDRGVIPAALREVTGNAAADLDYEVLAGVLLQTVLRVIRGNDQGDTGRTPAADVRVAAPNEELTAARGRLFELEAQVRILEHNNRTLADQLARRELQSADSLSAGQRALAHLMIQKPSTRG